MHLDGHPLRRLAEATRIIERFLPQVFLRPADNVVEDWQGEKPLTEKWLHQTREPPVLVPAAIFWLV